MKPIASIIILTYNNLSYTRQCLDSIFTKTDAPEFEVIVVDNASKDETPAYLRSLVQKYRNFRVIFNDENVGFSAANNQGAQLATGEYLIFLNNDIVVTHGWLAGLLAPLQNDSVGMTGPVTNSSGNESRILVEYTELEDMDKFAAQYTQEHAGESREVTMLPFQCVALRRAVWEDVGPLDERFGVGMFEDDDYGMRLNLAGYKILCLEDVFVHHFGAASFSKLPTLAYARLFRQNRAKFEEKWGQKWQPHLVRTELLASILNDAIEANLYFAETIGKLESENAAHVSNLYQYQIIFASNGWAFLQFLLRIRRFFIPEGSRREAVLKLFLAELRDFKLHNLISIPHRLKQVMRRSRITSVDDKADLPLVKLKHASTGQVSAKESNLMVHHFVKPFVSVIMPVYNHADMLEGAAHSVLSSSYSHFELIILNDGSTDSIEPVLRRLRANPRVRIYQQPNQKLPRALTHALSFARGEFITWTSADNLFAPQAIESMANGLLENPEAVLIYADVQVIDENGQPLKDGSYRPQNITSNDPSIVRLHRNAQPLGSELDNYINACFMFRRSGMLALEAHYADDLRGLEDYDFWLRLQKCGSFHHLQNEDPLYFYRVHSRTMSQKLLIDQLQEHLERGQKMLAYEAERRKQASRRWTLVLDQSLLDREVQNCRDIAAALPVNLLCNWDNGELEDGSDFQIKIAKRLNIVSADTICNAEIFVILHPHQWELVWQSPYTIEEKKLKFWRGKQLNPLALKARELIPHRWWLPLVVGERTVIGCHLGLSVYPLDVSATRKIIAQNTWAYFVFIDIAGDANPLRGAEIVDGFENATYLDPVELGTPYQLYSALDILWLPPYRGEQPYHEYRQQLMLAYALARPFLAPEGVDLVAAPYQQKYLPENATLRFSTEINHDEIKVPILDSYLAVWQPVACLRILLDHANAIQQEWDLLRPDFGIAPVQIEIPHPWQPVSKNEPLKCLLAVDRLDKGGLEEVIAMLASRLPLEGIQTAVLCGESGGMVAERLQSTGIPVHIAEGKPEVVQKILDAEKPDLVSTHLLSLPILEAIGNIGIPVIETIHNTYVWFDLLRWQLERLRSRYFTRAIGVSDLVRRYYLHNNPDFDPTWINVIPNGADPQRVVVTDSAVARNKLGIPPDAFLFISLASYDERKNQIGILTAFDRMAQQFPQAHLLCAGSVASQAYYQNVLDYCASLYSKKRIRLEEYHRDTSLLLSAADVFVINSVYEGWSVAATEALFAGVPLIHSDCGSGRELVGPAGERGLLIPNPAGNPIDLRWADIEKLRGETIHNNTEELIQAMKQMIINDEFWRSRRSDLQFEAQRHYKIDNMVGMYSYQIRNVCGVTGLVKSSSKTK